MNRRDALRVGAGSLSALAGVATTPVLATPEDVRRLIEGFGDGVPTEGRVELETPEIAENGNTVPISVSVDPATIGGGMVEKIQILADGNPHPIVATFRFTRLSGMPSVTTKMRLARTQNVIALARMSDGSTRMAKNFVRVTIGGCGA